MPQRPPRLCPRCRIPHSDRCPVSIKAQDQQRGTAHERGYGSRWAKAAKGFLASHPLCHYSRLQGRTVAAECVDHATPPSGPSDPLFWDRSNWRPSTIAHNSAKGRRTEADYLKAIGVTPTH